MNRGIKIRLIAFVIVSAVGIVYVAGTYLGIVDRVLNRGLHVHATLPESGGLFVGSEVTYRGLKVGKITKMQATRSGARVDMTLDDGLQVPANSPIAVHNLSAVGEQYLDIVPRNGRGPYLNSGDTLVGNKESMPVPEDQLLNDLNSLVGSLDGSDLNIVVTELGTMFRGTAPSLKRMVDSAEVLVDAARKNQQATIDLLNTGKTVLQTQADHESDIRSFSKDLADLTGTLKSSDADLRTLLQGGPSTVAEVNSLLRGLEPTLPVFLSNLTTVNQVLTTNLVPLEEFFVVFPRVISSGFTGTPGDGFGHINLQMNYSVPPCTKGYTPKAQWRPGTDTTDIPSYPAKCDSPAPFNQRGSKYAPRFGSAGSPGSAYRVSTYDAASGHIDAGNGQSFVIGQPGGLSSVFGENSWQSLLVGPVTAK